MTNTKLCPVNVPPNSDISVEGPLGGCEAKYRSMSLAISRSSASVFPPEPMRNSRPLEVDLMVDVEPDTATFAADVCSEISFSAAKPCDAAVEGASSAAVSRSEPSSMGSRNDPVSVWAPSNGSNLSAPVSDDWSVTRANEIDFRGKS